MGKKTKGILSCRVFVCLGVSYFSSLSFTEPEKGEDLNPVKSQYPCWSPQEYTHSHLSHTHTRTHIHAYRSLDECRRRKLCERRGVSLEVLLVAPGSLNGLRMVFPRLSQRQRDLVWGEHQHFILLSLPVLVTVGGCEGGGGSTFCELFLWLLSWWNGGGGLNERKVWRETFHVPCKRSDLTERKSRGGKRRTCVSWKKNKWIGEGEGAGEMSG